MNNILSVNNLKKIFYVERPFLKIFTSPFQRSPAICALDSLSFSIKPGEIFGVVGPNGAGKTTLLKILAGLLWQDEGGVEILGQNYLSSGKTLRSNIGYVSSDERSFFWRLSGRDNLEFFGRLYGLNSKNVQARAERLFRDFQFEKHADRLFGDYSAGMKKKVAVMRALLHEPAILLLDEVTNSLDPASAEHVKSRIRDYISQKNNRAAIWSTHRLEELPLICDHVISIDSGRIVLAREVIEEYSLQKKQRYMLKTKPLNGQLEAFCSTFHGELHEIKSCDDLNEFIFNNIEEEEFSKIVTVAVKDYGAYVLFAGYLEKLTEGRTG